MQFKLGGTIVQIFIIGLFCFLSIACGFVFAEQSSPDEEKERLQRDVFFLQELIEEALAWRLMSVTLFSDIEKREKYQQPLTHSEIQDIHQGALDYIGLREKILSLAQQNKHYLVDNQDIHLVPGKGTCQEQSVRLIGDQKYEKNSILYLDPYDSSGALILKRIKLSVAAALVLYDNYLLAIYPYQQNFKARKLVNFDNSRVPMMLQSVTASYYNPAYRFMVQQALVLLEKEKNLKMVHPIPDEQSGYLDLLITGSFSYNELRENNIVKDSGRLGKAINRGVIDNINFFSSQSLNIMSGLLGNTVGLVQTRKGKMLRLPDAEKKILESLLKPLDILLEKTPFRLTDKMIPGYFGHVAIWLGGPEDWEREGLNIIDEPIVKRYLTAIKNGEKIVEALRPGVMINSLNHFLNIDDLAVLRHQKLTTKLKEEYLIRALQQVGKKYDFNFDVETDRKIVCSELAYVVYHDVDWPTSKSMGRVTISPDNVAYKAMGSGPFKVEQLYVAGNKMKQNPERDFVQLLAVEARKKQVWKKIIPSVKNM